MCILLLEVAFVDPTDEYNINFVSKTIVFGCPNSMHTAVILVFINHNYG